MKIMEWEKKKNEKTKRVKKWKKQDKKERERECNQNSIIKRKDWNIEFFFSIN